jgi:hypothetical protein
MPARRGLRVALSAALLLTTQDLGAASLGMMAPPQAALHMPPPSMRPGALAAPTPPRPSGQERKAPRPEMKEASSALPRLPRLRLRAWLDAALSGLREALFPESPAVEPIDLWSVKPDAAMPRARPAAAPRPRQAAKAPALPMPPVPGGLELEAPAPPPLAAAPIPPPSLTPIKSHIRRLARSADLMEITARGERVAGFQPMRLHWKRSYAGTAPVVQVGPASPARPAAGAGTRVRVSDSIEMVGYEPDKPFGQRTIYEETRPDGSKTQFRASPLVFDLGGRGVTTSARVVLFDIKGSGRPDHIKRINDIAEWTGALAFDADRDGVSGEGGHELFGDATDLDGDGRPDGYADGFAALNALVRRAVLQDVLPPSILVEGRLDAAAFESLEKAYGLRMKVGSLHRAAVPLSRSGVRALWFSRGAVHRQHDFDGEGNDVSRQSGAVFTRADGTTGAYADIWFAHK